MKTGRVARRCCGEIERGSGSGHSDHTTIGHSTILQLKMQSINISAPYIFIFFKTKIEFFTCLTDLEVLRGARNDAGLHETH